MERIINYSDLPYSRGESIHLRMETDPVLYLELMKKGYKIVNNIFDTVKDTIFVTGKRQSTSCKTVKEYIEKVDTNIESDLEEAGITKPKTYEFNYQDLVDHKYKLPFVFKNELANGGKEKFLIATEEDYENLIKTCIILFDRYFFFDNSDDSLKYRIDYKKYFTENFVIQEYIDTPTDFNTTVRLITTPTDDLLYASLKYNPKCDYHDETTLLGYLLTDIFPLSSKSIVSNTLSGGSNIIIGEPNYEERESSILRSHKIDSSRFQKLVKASQRVHKDFAQELGIICGFDYI